MDTSERYILMCTKAKELQNTKLVEISDSHELPYEIGDYVFSTNGIDIIGSLISKPVLCYTFPMYDTCQIVIKCAKYASAPRDFLDALIWLPRQDQLQAMFLQGLAECAKVRAFIEWLDTHATYNAHHSTLEQLWLKYYMYEIHHKAWNALLNIRDWEPIVANPSELPVFRSTALNK